jgi:hypothetical protein
VADAVVSNDMYLIWSHEHRQWWGPGRYGYVQSIAKAGRYTHAEALDICAAAVPGDSRRLGALPELPVREADVLEIRDRFRAQFPSTPREYWE